MGDPLAGRLYGQAEGRLVSFLGMGPLEQLDLPAGPLALRPGDQLLLMSDGVYNALSDQELLKALGAGSNAPQALEAAILQKGYQNQDNYTAVILACEGGNLPARATPIGGKPIDPYVLLFRYRRAALQRGRVGIKTAGEDQVLAVLADGLGGHGGGQIAASLAVDTVCGGWEGASSPIAYPAHPQSPSGNPAAADPRMQNEIHHCGPVPFPRYAEWAYAGDSRLYRFLNGALAYQTRDHSASQVAVLLGQIQPEQLRFHEDRSRIFRALGQEGGLNVDMGNVPLLPGEHAFLLCSDGFWEYVYEAEMLQTLAQASSPEDWIGRMRQILSQRIPPNNDNNSAAAIWLRIPERS